jgi:hypothetical protein
MTAIAAGQGADQIGNPEALTGGFSAAFIGAAVVAVVGALAAAALLRIPARTEVADEPSIGQRA